MNEIERAISAEARGWLRDCGFSGHLSESDVIIMVSLHYEGGWNRFERDCEALTS